MNQHNDQAQAAEVDPQVSDQYASLAGEKTPAHLDQAVLREAARAVRADNRKGSFGAWFRPVAFMTSVGLSLAIILDLSDTELFEPESDSTFEATPKVLELPGSAADTAGRSPGQPALNEIKRQEKLAPPASSIVDAPDTSRDNAAGGSPREAATESTQTDQAQLRKMRMEAVPAIAPPPADAAEDQDHASHALAVEAGIAEQRVQEVERAMDANLQSRPGTATQLAAPQSAITTEADMLMAPGACSEEQKADVEEWWKCIASLRQSGRAEVADLELENLRATFPDFEPPE